MDRMESAFSKISKIGKKGEKEPKSSEGSQSLGDYKYKNIRQCLHFELE